MNHNEFFKALKQNELKHVYLFHGEEEYIKEEAYKRLADVLLPQFSELNLSIFDQGSADEIITSCTMAPFMAENRVVLCRFIPKDNDAKKLSDFIDKLPSETTLIFMVRGKADGKMLLIKKLKGMGAEVLFEYLSENDAAKWIMQHALLRKCTVNVADAQFMVKLVGNDMLSINNELSKLCDYVGDGGVITREIISSTVIKNLEYQLYNAYSYFVNGKLKDGFSALEAMTSGKNRDSEALGIAGYFLSCMKATLTAHDLIGKKASRAELEKLTGKKGYALNDLCANAKKFTRNELLSAIEAFSFVSQAMIVYGRSSWAALIDGITAAFSRLSKK